jgi:glycosyltransferase involved in cell wall biosynthesis
MKTVWILNHYASLPGQVGGTRHYYLAKHLHDHEWQAGIVAAGHEHSTGKKLLGPHELRRFEWCDGVPFLWLHVTGYSDNGPKRILNMLTYSIEALIPNFTSELLRPDVVIGSQVHPLAALAGAVLAHRYSVPFVFEVRDLWPLTLIEMGRISEGGLQARALGALERWLYRRAARIITLLPKACDHIVPLGIPEDKIMYIPNGADVSGFPLYFSRNGRPEFQVMYFGAHGNANGLDCLVEAMAKLKKRTLSRPVKLRLIGEGPLKSALREKAISIGLENVSFEPPVPKQDIPKIASEADAFVIAVRDLPIYRFGISMNKLFDYMAAGRPTIIASGATNNPIQEAGCGITVPPENPEALADTIERLASTPKDVLLQMGKNGRSYVEKHYDYKVLAARLAEVLDSVVRESKALHR